MNDSMEAVLDELKALRRRTKALERQRWAVLAIIPFATLVAFAPGQKELEAKSLKIMNDDGRAVVTLASDEDGGTVELTTSGGTQSLLLDVSKTSGGQLSIFSIKGGRPRVKSFVSEDTGVVRVSNADAEKGRLP